MFFQARIPRSINPEFLLTFIADLLTGVISDADAALNHPAIKGLVPPEDLLFSNQYYSPGWNLVTFTSRDLILERVDPVGSSGLKPVLKVTVSGSQITTVTFEHLKSQDGGPVTQFSRPTKTYSQSYLGLPISAKGFFILRIYSCPRAFIIGGTSPQASTNPTDESFGLSCTAALWGFEFEDNNPLSGPSNPPYIYNRTLLSDSSYINTGNSEQVFTCFEGGRHNMETGVATSTTLRLCTYGNKHIGTPNNTVFSAGGNLPSYGDLQAGDFLVQSYGSSRDPGGWVTGLSGILIGNTRGSNGGYSNEWIVRDIKTNKDYIVWLVFSTFTSHQCLLTPVG